jgi:hypothetical protein
VSEFGDLEKKAKAYAKDDRVSASVGKAMRAKVQDYSAPRIRRPWCSLKSS